jgi:hypothetical protein
LPLISPEKNFESNTWVQGRVGGGLHTTDWVPWRDAGFKCGRFVHKKTGALAAGLEVWSFESCRMVLL